MTSLQPTKASRIKSQPAQDDKLIAASCEMRQLDQAIAALFDKFEDPCGRREARAVNKQGTMSKILNSYFAAGKALALLEIGQCADESRWEAPSMTPKQAHDICPGGTLNVDLPFVSDSGLELLGRTLYELATGLRHLAPLNSSLRASSLTIAGTRNTGESNEDQSF
jgi:hypothetical protein